MFAEGKLPEPAQVDGIGALWKLAKIERWGRASVVGDAALAEATEEQQPARPPQVPASRRR
jgi:hypothetical protein